MGQKFALIIGNSEYEDASLRRLVTPSGDVDALAGVLNDSAIGAFDDVRALLNESSASIRRAIARFFAQKKSDDLLLLYFSGHGVLDEQGHLHLAARDTERDLLSGTAIPANFVTGEMDRSPSRRQVFILDCCHSGAFSRGTKGVLGASVGTGAAFEGAGFGRVVLTATDATQYAWEGDQVIGQPENSVFTHFLIEGLRSGEADTDADGRITLDELYAYVYGQVLSRTPRQTPGKWSYRQQGEIVIANNPHPAKLKPAPLPGELQQTIEDSRPWVREGAVRELERLLNGSLPGLALAAHEALKRLAGDDSKRVAGAAMEILNAYEAMQGEKEKEREKEEAERAARERAEKEREKEKAERIAREKAEAERIAREGAERERVAKEKAEAERIAREKAEQEQLGGERVDKSAPATKIAAGRLTLIQWGALIILISLAVVLCPLFLGLQMQAGIFAKATSTAAEITATQEALQAIGGGGRIAFTSNRDGNREIYVMNADGLDPTRLTYNQAGDSDPAWSPDGARIAFSSERDGNWEIYVMNADGSDQTNLTNNSAADVPPAWSPDGARIAFYSYRDGNAEIYVMNADGSNQTRLTNNSANDYAPAWSPDGARIAFGSYRDNKDEIYVMNADGSNQTRLTNNSADDWDPAWQP
ncbi:MAG: PD40 domain-containing protein [Chloroflexi bacterium]|nr:PD40 domain-containing protein [Chloroflexota bacterium]